MKKLFFPLFLVFFSLLFSCNNESNNNYKPLRLLQYNVPLTIMAPDSVKVEKEDLILQQGLTFRNDAERYYVQLWMRKNLKNDILQLKGDLLTEVKEDRYFSKIVREDEDGFIFEKQIDSTYTNYDFRYCKIQADKEYIFQTGFIGTFTLEEVTKMYEGVRNQQK